MPRLRVRAISVIADLVDRRHIAPKARPTSWDLDLVRCVRWANGKGVTEQFVLAHKLREATASSMNALRLGGEGWVAEIDGAYFGGHFQPENRAADRLDRRLAENRSGKRQVVDF